MACCSFQPGHFRTISTVAGYPLHITLNEFSFIYLVLEERGSTLSDAAEDLASKLPVNCRADEVDVMCGDGAHWETVRRVFMKGE